MRDHATLGSVVSRMRRVIVVIAVVGLLPMLAWAQTIYRTPDGVERKMGNPAYDGRFVFTRIRYRGPGFGGFGGGSWSHDYPASDFYISDALNTLTRMRASADRTNVLELEDDAIFSNPITHTHGLAAQESGPLI